MIFQYEQRQLFIGGEWVDPVDGDVRESLDPATGKPWALAAFAGAQDTDRAIAAASDALGGPWKRFTPVQRAELLRRMASIMEDRIDHFAALESRDNGMLLSDARKYIGALAAYWHYYAGMATKIEGRTIPVEPGVLAYTERLPVGVVGAIAPWNAPTQMVTWKLAPAIAAGCTVVFKSAEQTPVTAYEFARHLENLGLPPGVVNIICGEGVTAGKRLVDSTSVNKITFTGEHRTAQEIMRGSAVNLKRLTFECGGKAPHIIFADADLNSAINAAVHNSFVLTGQSCALGSRMLVQRDIYDRVVAEVGRRAQSIRVGLPADSATQLGPQVSAAQLDKTLSYISLGKEEGARLVAGGERVSAPGLNAGYFVKPTVFADVSNDMRIAQEEIFGPVASIIPFDDEEHAVRLANQIAFGLTAGVWTQDIGKAHRVASQIEAGTVWINHYRYIRYAIPYGGMKLSGLGRENGQESLDNYLETRSTVLKLESHYADAYAN